MPMTITVDFGSPCPPSPPGPPGPPCPPVNLAGVETLLANIVSELNTQGPTLANILGQMMLQTAALQQLAAGLTPKSGAMMLKAGAKLRASAGSPAVPTTFTLAALAAEIAANPMGLTLNAPGNPNTGKTLTQLASPTINDDADAAALLNAVGVGASYLVYDNAVGFTGVIAAVAPADFAALTAIEIQQLSFLFAGGNTLDCTQAGNQQILAGLFSGASSATQTAVAAAMTRQGSRAEVLWGTGFAVTSNEVGTA